MLPPNMPVQIFMVVSPRLLRRSSLLPNYPKDPKRIEDEMLNVETGCDHPCPRYRIRLGYIVRWYGSSARCTRSDVAQADTSEGSTKV